MSRIECHVCGASAYNACSPHCLLHMEPKDREAFRKGIEGLGDSIRRFAERAEICAIRDDALLMLDDIRNGFTSVAQFGVVERALGRLAEIAMERHGL